MKLLVATLAAFALTAAPAALARTVHLTASSNGKTVSIRKGDKVVVQLDANSSTGYHWSTTRTPNKRVVKLISSKYVATPTTQPIAGSGGKQVIRLTATGKGKASFATAYLSPGIPHTVGGRFRVGFRVR